MKILFVIFAVALASGQEIPNAIRWDVNDFMAHQNQHQGQQMPMQVHMEQGREADEPVVGSPLLPPLIGLKLAKPFMFGIPGLRYSNLNIGHLGHMKFANSLLGSENPMANEDDNQQHVGNAQQYQVDPQGYQFQPQLESPQQYQVDQQQQLGFPLPQQQEVFHHWHLANPELQAQQQPQIVGASPCQLPQQIEVGAPHQQMPMHHHFDQPVGPMMPIVQPGFTQENVQRSENERTWDWKG